MNNIVWSSSFKRAFKRRILGKPYESEFKQKMAIFVEDPFDPRLKSHKLSGKLEGLWAFTVEYNCRVIFEFIGEGRVIFIDIGTHDEVY
ncbi:MAG: type II toxin-antitoxin system mRNA interferase toxin, RelE/StbE family [Candidatus Sumerlaeota bacterium]|nr:type II toxin-antitoxin system mRNA interferase toxin, RelE/StbE family [Candidatus Sumerlaeota bacterium]